MTGLKCGVTSCAHNCDHCCCKDEIIVEGNHATESHNTCCGSFDSRERERYVNMNETPNGQLKVGCEAVNCVYNENRFCHADHIDISGGGAGTAEQTECATFKMR